MTQTKEVRKQWWESKSTVLLKEFAKNYGGTFAAAKFQGLKYKGQHVRVPLARGLGTCDIAVTDPNNDSSGNAYVITIKYSYRPRRKLEFDLFSAKRQVLAWFSGQLREATLPNSAMNKQFRARASHPSVLRSVLKQEGLAETLDLHPSVYFRLRIKAGRASLTCTEKSKKPDVHMIADTLKLARLMIHALEEQGIIHDPQTHPIK
ncbi:hypothetical protein [Paenibacillus macerans]|uniref:hypothetical protein n=1 Tax=Paenibacillus macerans TaxID=44252 RepID=UPI003D3148AA